MCITVIKSTANDDKYTVKKKRGTDGRNTKKNHISRKGTGRRVPLYGQAGSRISWSYRMAKNEYDGTVTMEVQGSERMINKLLVRLNTDHFIRIEWMDSEEIPIREDEKGFQIKY